MGPEYTTCVEPKDWSDLNKAYLAVLGVAVAAGGLLAVLTGGSSLLISGLAFLEALRYVLDWLLHVKLICLHRFHSESDCICGGPSATTVCAIGEVMTTEIVGEGKNAVEKIDDDFAINLALFPFDLNEFAQRGFVDWTLDMHDKHSDAFSTYKKGLIDIATKPGEPQGDLLTRQPVPYGIPKEFGYLTTMVMQKGGDYFPYSNVIGRSPGSDDKKVWADYERDNASKSPVRFSVPVLHCEFEGSRTRDLLAALEGFPFGSSFCKKNWFTKFICRIVSAVLLPIVLADLALAWLRNTEGSTAPALVGGGTIGPKSRVIVRGSWRFDSGHSGWNEIHAVRIVQCVESVPSDPAEFKLFLHLWCEVFAQTPTSDGFPRGGGGGVYKPQDVPAAEVTLIAQGQPENQWEFHPLVDGCQPPIRRSDPPSEPSILH